VAGVGQDDKTTIHEDIIHGPIAECGFRISE
jgi:hypothetical protein